MGAVECGTPRLASLIASAWGAGVHAPRTSRKPDSCVLRMPGGEQLALTGARQPCWPRSIRVVAILLRYGVKACWYAQVCRFDSLLKCGRNLTCHFGKRQKMEDALESDWRRTTPTQLEHIIEELRCFGSGALRKAQEDAIGCSVLNCRPQRKGAHFLADRCRAKSRQ